MHVGWRQHWNRLHAFDFAVNVFGFLGRSVVKENHFGHMIVTTWACVAPIDDNPTLW